MDESRALSGEEESSMLDLVNAAFQYLTESKYPVKCTEARKRAIRKKAAMLIVRDGVMFFKKKKKGKVSKCEVIQDRILDCPILPRRYLSLDTFRPAANKSTFSVLATWIQHLVIWE